MVSGGDCCHPSNSRSENDDMSTHHLGIAGSATGKVEQAKVRLLVLRPIPPLPLGDLMDRSLEIATTLAKSLVVIHAHLPDVGHPNICLLEARGRLGIADKSDRLRRPRTKAEVCGGATASHDESASSLQRGEASELTFGNEKRSAGHGNRSEPHETEHDHPPPAQESAPSLDLRNLAHAQRTHSPSAAVP